MYKNLSALGKSLRLIMALMLHETTNWAHNTSPLKDT